MEPDHSGEHNVHGVVYSRYVLNAHNVIIDVDDNTHNGSAVKQLGSMERMCPQNWWANGMQGWRRMP